MTVRALAVAIQEAAMAGDVDAVRIANDVISRLLSGEAANGSPSNVVSLAKYTRRSALRPTT
ncbi:MAG: hypothetical protein WCJ30_19260 [Deltaproteobacteria bacterium]